MHGTDVYWSKQPVERAEIACVSEELTTSLYKAIKRRHEGSNTDTKAGRNEVEVMKYETNNGIVRALS
jgi:hypothetical protein